MYPTELPSIKVQTAGAWRLGRRPSQGQGGECLCINQRVVSETGTSSRLITAEREVQATSEDSLEHSEVQSPHWSGVSGWGGLPKRPGEGRQPWDEFQSTEEHCTSTLIQLADTPPNGACELASPVSLLPRVTLHKSNSRVLQCLTDKKLLPDK